MNWYSTGHSLTSAEVCLCAVEDFECRSCSDDINSVCKPCMHMSSLQSCQTGILFTRFGLSTRANVLGLVDRALSPMCHFIPRPRLMGNYIGSKGEIRWNNDPTQVISIEVSSRGDSNRLISSFFRLFYWLGPRIPMARPSQDKITQELWQLWS